MVVTVNNTDYTLDNQTQTVCEFYYEDFFCPTSATADGDPRVAASRLFDKIITCVPDGDQYQWGALWELLVIIISLHMVWSVSLLLMWFEVTRYSPLVG